MQITREEQDAFAVESHRRAIDAIDYGKFQSEIVPVSVPQRRGDPIIVSTDEHPRYRRDGDCYVIDTSGEDMGKLRPAFRKDGTVTAGNFRGGNDGATALLMMSADKAKEPARQSAGHEHGYRRPRCGDRRLCPLDSAPHLSSNAELPKNPAPNLGQHTRSILENMLGMNAQDVDGLAADGVIQTDD